MGLFLLPGMSIAKEWYAKPTIRLRSEYDDNILLQPGKNAAVFGWQASAIGEGGVRSALYNLALYGQVDVFRYWGQSNLDRENWSVGINADHKFTERNKLTLDANYISDTTLTSEFLTSGFLTGTFFGNKQIGRQFLSITPTWNYQLSDTSQISTNFMHQEVRYDSPSRNTSFLQNYQTDSIGLAYSDQWNIKTHYNLSFNALRYEISNSTASTDNFSLTLSLDHKYSETLNFNFMAGIRRTDTLDINTSSSAYGPLFGAGFNKQFELGSLSANYTRNTSPSGIGLFLVSDDINVNISYYFLDKLKLMLSAEAFYTSSSNNAQSFNRNFYTIEPKLAWTFNNQLSIIGGYRFRMQEYDSNSNNNASSNSFFIYLNYSFDDITSNHF